MLTNPDWNFKEERFILCEGKDDRDFLECLIKHRQLPAFKVMDAYEASGGKAGGWTGFWPALNGFIAQTKFGKLKGIAIITDNDKPNTCADTEKELVKLGYVPSKPKRKGILNGIPLLLILIPDSDAMGNLEVLCLPALCDEWVNAKGCVDAYLNCTGAVSWSKQKEFPKAKARSIIAGNFQEDPSRGLGYLFKKKKHLVEHTCFDRLADTLSRFDEIISTIKR